MGIASLRVTPQNRSRGGLDGDQSGFTEFCVVNRQNAARQIDVLAAKVEDFANPHAGDGQESEEAMVGPAAQRLRGGQCKGRRQQIADLSFLHQGITFTVYGREQGVERIIPFDLRGF